MAAHDEHAPGEPAGGDAEETPSPGSSIPEPDVAEAGEPDEVLGGEPGGVLEGEILPPPDEADPFPEFLAGLDLRPAAPGRSVRAAQRRRRGLVVVSGVAALIVGGMGTMLGLLSSGVHPDKPSPTPTDIAVVAPAASQGPVANRFAPPYFGAPPTDGPASTQPDVGAVPQVRHSHASSTPPPPPAPPVHHPTARPTFPIPIVPLPPVPIITPTFHPPTFPPPPTSCSPFPTRGLSRICPLPGAQTGNFSLVP